MIKLDLEWIKDGSFELLLHVVPCMYVRAEEGKEKKLIKQLHFVATSIWSAIEAQI